MSARLEEFIVTTDDGHLFACGVEEVGGINAPRQRRWIFEDASTRYVGPPYYGSLTPGHVQRLVSEWWELRKQLMGRDQ